MPRTNRRRAAVIARTAALLLAAGGLPGCIIVADSDVHHADGGTKATVTYNNASAAVSSAAAAASVRNVIFFVSDGMGVGMAASAEQLSAERGELFFTTAPVVGLVRTDSLTGLITDSAAGATAYATGQKTRNGMVAYLPGGREPATVLELARDAGLATGLITNTDITDATPAAFAAHAESRRMHGPILDQMLASRTGLLVGGTDSAAQQLAPQLGTSPQDAVAALAAERGYRLADDLAEYQIAAGSGEPLLFSTAARGPKGAFGPPLADILPAALDRLSKDEDGFLLVVECEETDTAGHANDIDRTVAGVRETDDAVRVAVEFARRNPGTLVVLTADHDTGAMTVNGVGYEGETEVRWISTGHTAHWVPLFAFGEGAGAFAGVHDNTDLFDKITAALGLD